MSLESAAGADAETLRELRDIVLQVQDGQFSHLPDELIDGNPRGPLLTLKVLARVGRFLLRPARMERFRAMAQPRVDAVQRFADLSGLEFRPADRQIRRILDQLRPMVMPPFIAPAEAGLLPASARPSIQVAAGALIRYHQGVPPEDAEFAEVIATHQALDDLIGEHLHGMAVNGVRVWRGFRRRGAGSGFAAARCRLAWRIWFETHHPEIVKITT